MLSWSVHKKDDLIYIYTCSSRNLHLWIYILLNFIGIFIFYYYCIDIYSNISTFSFKWLNETRESFYIRPICFFPNCKSLIFDLRVLLFREIDFFVSGYILWMPIRYFVNQCKERHYSKRHYAIYIKMLVKQHLNDMRFRSQVLFTMWTMDIKH